MFYGPDTYYGEEVSVLEMDGQVGGAAERCCLAGTALACATVWAMSQFARSQACSADAAPVAPSPPPPAV